MVAQDNARTLTKKYSSFSIPVPRRQPSHSESMTERLLQSRRRMMAKMTKGTGPSASKKHLAGYYPSNVTMKGKLYKKRKGINRLTSTLTSLTNDTSQHTKKVWPLRFVSLKDGVISYYKLRECFDENVPGLDKNALSKMSPQGYKSDGYSDDGVDFEESLPSNTQERGAIDLRRTGVMLRLSYPTNSFGQEFQQFEESGREDGGNSKSPTPYQFEIVYNNLMNPKEWNTWTLAAPSKESLFNWLAAISSVIYANRGALGEEDLKETPLWIDADRDEELESPDPKLEASFSIGDIISEGEIEELSDSHV